MADFPKSIIVSLVLDMFVDIFNEQQFAHQETKLFNTGPWDTSSFTYRLTITVVYTLQNIPVVKCSLSVIYKIKSKGEKHTPEGNLDIT